MDRRHTNFPKHFFWGASVAAHQVEGDNHNQWSVFELSHAKELAQTAHQNLGWLPNWEDIKDRAEEPDNYVSGGGVDHYKRYKDDFKLLTELNLNAFRFSIEWSRLEPEEGKWDEKEIQHYKNYIAQLRKQHIEPFMTLWHWSLPVWFTDKGGFENKDNLRYFERYVEKISEELIEDVEYVITLNEPNNYASISYLLGKWPPQKTNFFTFLKVYWNLTRAHRKSYKILKTKKPTLQIGFAPLLANIQPKRPHNYLDLVSTQWMRYFWNWWFVYRVRSHIDYVGINYYFSDYYKGLGKRANPKIPVNDLGWYMEPEGLYPLMLRAWSKFKKPIFITENGLADEGDHYRRWWIEQTVVAMERALSEGVDLRGYFHWSLLDNFEWAEGWWPKFGLVSVDREHGMKRTVRQSAKWFANLIANIQGRSQNSK
jgi:beta-glucosidase